jgi:hypothetical protein
VRSPVSFRGACVTRVVPSLIPENIHTSLGARSLDGAIKGQRNHTPRLKILQIFCKGSMGIVKSHVGARGATRLSRGYIRGLPRSLTRRVKKKKAPLLGRENLEGGFINVERGESSGDQVTRGLLQACQTIQNHTT